MKHVVLSNKLKKIEASLFSYCYKLTYVNITSGITSIGNNAFYQCSSLISTNLHSGITSIGDYAFYNCTGLTSTNLQSSTTSIGTYAFAFCTGLTSLILPEKIEVISNYTFYCCSSLSSAIIPYNVNKVKSNAFDGCSNLTRVFYNGTSSDPGIDALNVFSNCDKLNEVNVPYNYPNQTFCGLKVSRECTAVGSCGTNIYWTLNTSNCNLIISGTGNTDNYQSESKAPWYSYVSSLVNAIICNGIKRIGNYAFYECKHLTSLSIPDSVTLIGTYAFSKSGLTSITINNRIKTITMCAFEYCQNLSTVIIGNAVTRIMSDSFNGCLRLRSISIPANVKYIGMMAFYNCSSLNAIHVASDNNNFMDIDGVLYSKNEEMFTLFLFPCGKSGHFRIPSGTEAITNYSFDGCNALTSIRIPSSVTIINDFAFLECANLEFVLYEGTSDPGTSDAFTDCNKLTNASVPLGYSSSTFCGLDIDKRSRGPKKCRISCKSKKSAPLNMFVVILQFAVS